MVKPSWESMKGHLRGSHLCNEVKLTSRGQSLIYCPQCPLGRPDVNAMISHIWSTHLPKYFPPDIVLACQRRKTKEWL